MVTSTVPDRGWSWVVMCASFGVHIVLGCLVYCVGIIHTALLDNFDQSVYVISWAGSISSSLVSLSGPLSSFLMNRFNCRVTIMIGGIFTCVGCFSSAFVDSLNLTILFYGFVTGIGTGLSYSAAVVAVGFGFQTRRNLASGIAVAGIGVGMFCLSPAITAANRVYGYSGLFLILAGIGLHISLFGALIRPSRLEIQAQKIRRRNITETNNNLWRNIKTQTKIFKSPPFICFCISNISWNAGLFIVFLHLPSYVMTKNTSRFEASFLLSVAGMCSSVSRIITGLFSTSNRVNELVVYSVCFGILGLTTVFFPFFSISYGAQMFYSVVLGLFFGNCYAIMSSISVQIVGIENLATAFGIEMLFGGLGMLIGPPVAGLIIGNGGTYKTSFIFAGIAIILGSILGLVTLCLNKGKQHLAEKKCLNIEMKIDGQHTGNEVTKLQTEECEQLME